MKGAIVLGVGLGARVVGAKLGEPLGIADGSAGQSVHTSGDVPALAGTVLEAQNTPHGFSVILKLDKPTPAIAHLIGFPMGGPIHVSVRFYLYGAEGAAHAGNVEAGWREWLGGRFQSD